MLIRLSYLNSFLFSLNTMHGTTSILIIMEYLLNVYKCINADDRFTVHFQNKILYYTLAWRNTEIFNFYEWITVQLLVSPTRAHGIKTKNKQFDMKISVIVAYYTIYDTTIAFRREHKYSGSSRYAIFSSSNSFYCRNTFSFFPHKVYSAFRRDTDRFIRTHARWYWAYTSIFQTHYIMQYITYTYTCALCKHIKRL